MKIVVAPDSFKGSLSAKKICNIVENVSKKMFEDVTVIKVPMADGGEGTVESLIEILNAEMVNIEVKNPLGNPIIASYGIFDETKAIMEMAAASGITTVSNEERNVLEQNTFGTGEMILDAINRGIKTIYIGIGGSATNDGGMGFASAIGVKFLDINGRELNPIPKNFMKISTIDRSKINPKIADVEIIIMSDVKNPLLGNKGATYVFGRQKGVTNDDIQWVENGMEHYITLVEKTFEISVKSIPGAGAAGGLGAGLLAFTNANIKEGVQTIMDILEVESKIKDADLVFTGEGMMDYQSAYGKVASGVGLLAQKYQVPCIAIVGSMGKDAEKMYDFGITSIMTTVNGVMSLEQAIDRADELFYSAVERACRIYGIHSNKI